MTTTTKRRFREGDMSTENPEFIALKERVLIQMRDLAHGGTTKLP